MPFLCFCVLSLSNDWSHCNFHPSNKQIQHEQPSIIQLSRKSINSPSNKPLNNLVISIDYSSLTCIHPSVHVHRSKLTPDSSGQAAWKTFSHRNRALFFRTGKWKHTQTIHKEATFINPLFPSIMNRWWHNTPPNHQPSTTTQSGESEQVMQFSFLLDFHPSAEPTSAKCHPETPSRKKGVIRSICGCVPLCCGLYPIGSGWQYCNNQKSLVRFFFVF